MAFEENLQDVERLLELHQQIGGNKKGRRFGLEVLNKSAIVLITAFWEAYCEDIAAEGLAHIVKHAKSADVLPTELKKIVATELKNDSHELAIWKVSDGGWRNYLSARLEALNEARARKLNTPKTANINTLFASAVGIDRISDSWHWPPKMTTKQAADKLDRYVELRGAIAHRGKYSQTVKKAEVISYLDFSKELAGITGGQVNKHVLAITGERLWKK
jgi:hypothetical protein